MYKISCQVFLVKISKYFLNCIYDGFFRPVFLGGAPYIRMRINWENIRVTLVPKAAFFVK